MGNREVLRLEAMHKTFQKKLQSSQRLGQKQQHKSRRSMERQKSKLLCCQIQLIVTTTPQNHLRHFQHDLRQEQKGQT